MIAPPPSPVIMASPHRWSRLLSGIAVLVGGLVLVGWMLDIAPLKSVLPGWARMKANTALAFILAGLSLRLLGTPHPFPRWRGLAQGCAAMVALLGLLTLSQDLFGWNLGMDQWLFAAPGDPVGTSAPGRMAPATAFNFVLLGAAICLLDMKTRRGPRPAPVLALLVALLGLLALIGYSYGAPGLYRFSPYKSVAFPTALMFIILAVGVLCARPAHGPLPALLSPWAGGVMARRLLPVVIGLPLVLGWLRLVGERAGLYGLEMGLTLMVGTMIIVLTGVLCWSAVALNRLALAQAHAEAEGREYQRAQEQLQRLLEAAPDAMVIIDHAGKIVMANARAETLFGYRRIELLDQPVEILMPARVWDMHSGHRTRFFTAPQVRPMGAGLELYGQRKDGTEFPVEISLSPLATAESLLVTAAIRDIAERKGAEAAIAAKNRDLHTLLYVMSHDLREPLRAIAGFSRLVQERYAERLDAKGQEFLMYTVGGAQRMDALLNDILALSRAQRLDPPTVAIDGTALVEEAVKRLEARIKECRATVQIARDFPGLYADKTWAMQAIYNLIANALKFTRAGEAPDIEIAPYRSDGQVGIVVCDRGPGVAPEHAERIFQLFQRAVGRDVEGTGAGLAIVRQVAERHQGRAWVQPRAGGGSEFIITFGKPGP